MKQFRCGDVVPGCGTVFVAESDQEILRHVEEHARDEHAFQPSTPKPARSRNVFIIRGL